VIAAIALGTPAAVFVAVAAGAAHTLAAALGHGDPRIEPAAQTLLFLCIALTAAKLAQWRTSDFNATAPGHPPEKSAAHALQHFTAGTELWPLSGAIIGLVRQFRTPLTSIEGAGWVLEDAHLPDQKRRELVGIVRKEASRLNRVLMDVLDYTQSRYPRFRSIDVSKLVDDVIQLAGTTEAERTPVRKNVPPDLPALRGDPEQITQVLLNLVMNSIQATPAGREIEVSAHVHDDMFVITVKDYGTGIPATAVSRIFEPFFTTHEHRLGLGLPLALQIVTEHGGRITVDCQENQGTCVSVILPVNSTPPP
jgi:signal transduction histidine kinase